MALFRATRFPYHRLTCGHRVGIGVPLGRAAASHCGRADSPSCAGSVGQCGQPGAETKAPPETKAQTKAQTKPKPKPTPKPKAESAPTLKNEVSPPEVVESAPEVSETTPESDATQLAALAREELANMETSDLPVSESGSVQDAVAATIQRAVVNRWTRPPSARNGMVSVLSIQLVPTGEVVGVGVLTTSGDVAFDRSAISAVERVGKFPEIAQLDSRVFETTFRRFQLIFRPEDLRY